MSQSPAPRKEQVREDWAKRGSYWDEWADQMGEQSDIFNLPFVEIADIRPGQRTLDLASGAGEPALTIAKKVGPSGHVTATDLVDEMLAGIRRRAADRKLTNLDFRLADMENLPFEDESFDRVTCRFGIMFSSDISRTFAEAFRVLKPGGRAAYMVWGPLTDNTVIAETTAVAEKELGFWPWNDDINPFRFPEAGILGPEMAKAGFTGVREEDIIVNLRRPLDGRPFWQAQIDMGVGPHLDTRDPAVRERINQAVEAALEKYIEDDFHVFKSHVRVVVGDKPA
ncbi:MAG: class I SAM-dependent methyltransferase [Alphaproteobacteria bacterium]